MSMPYSFGEESDRAMTKRLPCPAGNPGNPFTVGEIKMPDEKLQNMTLQDAEAELSKRVYAATRLIEELEFAGHVRGNGHHIRQEIAAFAVKLLREQWED